MKKFLTYWCRGATHLLALAGIIALFIAVYLLLYQRFGENAALIIVGFLGASCLLGMALMILDS